MSGPTPGSSAARTQRSSTQSQGHALWNLLDAYKERLRVKNAKRYVSPTRPSDGDCVMTEKPSVKNSSLKKKLRIRDDSRKKRNARDGVLKKGRSREQRSTGIVWKRKLSVRDVLRKRDDVLKRKLISEDVLKRDALTSSGSGWLVLLRKKNLAENVFTCSGNLQGRRGLKIRNQMGRHDDFLHQLCEFDSRATRSEQLPSLRRSSR
jgi:hypothetical protein